MGLAIGDYTVSRAGPNPGAVSPDRAKAASFELPPTTDKHPPVDFTDASAPGSLRTLHSDGLRGPSPGRF